VTSREANGRLSELFRGNGAMGRWIADGSNHTNLPTLLGVGVVAGAIAGVVAARRAQADDDVISGKVSIDLLERIELLTIRLNLHRS
jgi:hypothetical protein